MLRGSKQKERSEQLQRGPGGGPLECGAPVSMKNTAAVKNRFWTLLIRREGRFLPEFGSFVRGEAIVKMSELRLKGVRRIDLKIITSDPDLSAIAKDVEALNDA